MAHSGDRHLIPPNSKNVASEKPNNVVANTNQMVGLFQSGRSYGEEKREKDIMGCYVGHAVGAEMTRQAKREWER